MLKFSIVGCGRIAKRHADLLGANQIDNANLAAVCDVDESRAKLYGQQFNVPWFTDMHQMMQSADVQVVALY